MLKSSAGKLGRLGGNFCKKKANTKMLERLRDPVVCDERPTPMVPVFSLNLFPPFIAPNRGNFFLGLTSSEFCLQKAAKRRVSTAAAEKEKSVWVPAHVDSSDGI